MRVERPYDILQRELKALPAPEAAIFSGLCAERLVACVWSFVHHEGLDAGIFLRVMEENWRILTSQTSPTKLSDLYNELREFIPHEEHYSYSLAGQAQNGLLCAAHCAHIILSGNPSDVRGSSDNCISAAELYVFVVDRNLNKGTALHNTGDEDALVMREIEKQLSDLKILRSPSTLTSKELTELRRLNFQYAIPPAIMIVTNRL